MPKPNPPAWEIVRCPRCDVAIMSSSEETVRTLLLCHIQICGTPEESQAEETTR